MQAHQVKPTHPRKQRKRVGRGDGSGSGTYSGRGLKGQKSRSGGGVRPGFEGGQNPQAKGLPMLRGFKNMFRVEYQPVNLAALSRLPDGVSDLTHAVLAQHRIIRGKQRAKLLARGEVTRAFRVSGIAVSKAAQAKIEAAGGAVEAEQA